MPQAYPYLAITDGTTSVVIQDGLGGVTNYPLTRGTWAPTSAGLRPDAQAGQSPYSDAVEELRIAIRGATPAAAMTNYRTLVSLLEQAERWANYEPVAPVLLYWAPQGSNVATAAQPYKCVVLGRAAGDETQGTTLSAKFADVGMLSEISDVRVKVKRRGLWIAPPDLAVTSSSVAIPGPWTASGMSAHNTASPALVSLSSIPVGSDTMFPSLGTPAYLISTDASSKITFKNANAQTATGWTSVNDSANLPKAGTNVLRYTPTATNTWQRSGASTITTTYRRMGVFATVRNAAPSSVGDFALRAGVRLRSTAGLTFDATYAAPVILPAGNAGFATPVFLGTFTTGDAGASTLELILEARVNFTTGTPTLDIDQIVLVDLGYPTQVASVPGAQLTSTTIFSAGTVSLVFDARPLTDLLPLAAIRQSSPALDLAFVGQDDVAPWITSTSLVSVLLACGGPTSALGARWRYTNAAGSSALSMTLNVTRSRGYVNPE